MSSSRLTDLSSLPPSSSLSDVLSHVDKLEKVAKRDAKIAAKTAAAAAPTAESKAEASPSTPQEDWVTSPPLTPTSSYHALAASVLSLATSPSHTSSALCSSPLSVITLAVHCTLLSSSHLCTGTPTPPSTSSLSFAPPVRPLPESVLYPQGYVNEERTEVRLRYQLPSGHNYHVSEQKKEGGGGGREEGGGGERRGGRGGGGGRRV